MLSFGKRTNTCFFCLKLSGKWKLEINTADGVIVKHVCDECKDYLDRMAKGESLYEMFEELHEEGLEVEHE